MEAPQEEVVGVSKGKRTKRLRPQSLITFTINAHSSNVDEEISAVNNNNSSPTPDTWDENFLNDDVPTEEEEETAKCLILLSQSGPPPPMPLDEMGLYQSKFNSKRYVETTDLGNGGKAGMYVYECKTCNRTFPSFQALGGHRASHKKPKLLTIEPRKQSFFYFSEQDEPSTTTNYNNNNNKFSPLSPKIHTCSYCGAEFTSGQALGGHMRRHRGGANNNTNLCLSPFSINQESANYNLKKPRNGLSLDLNLPAPTEYQNLQHPPKYPQEQPQAQKQQEQEQTALVLSTTPQLIDCHY